MTLRTPQQERWAIWAEKMLAKVASGEGFELPLAFGNQAERVAARGVEEAALKRGYLAHMSRHAGKVLFIPRNENATLA